MNRCGGKWFLCHNHSGNEYVADCGDDLPPELFPALVHTEMLAYSLLETALQPLPASLVYQRHTSAAGSGLEGREGEGAGALRGVSEGDGCGCVAFSTAVSPAGSTPGTIRVPSFGRGP